MLAFTVDISCQLNCINKVYALIMELKHTHNKWNPD